MTKKEFYETHTHCPKCNSGNVTKTNKTVKDKTPFSDDVNDASCNNCQWKGKLKNLVESPERMKQREVEQATMEIHYDAIVLGEDVWIPAAQVIHNVVEYSNQSVSMLNKTNDHFAELKKALNYDGDSITLKPSDVHNVISNLYQHLAANPSLLDKEDELSKSLVALGRDAIGTIIWLSDFASKQRISALQEFTTQNCEIIVKYAALAMHEYEQQNGSTTTSESATTDNAPKLTVVKD